MKSQRTKNTLLQFAQGNRTNQKLQESIFSPTQKRNSNFFSPTLRCFNFFSHRTVRNRTDIASNVNRFVESVCGLDSRQKGQNKKSQILPTHK